MEKKRGDNVNLFNGRLSLTHRWNSAELLHHAHLIKETPTFHNLPTVDAVDAYLHYRKPLPSRRDAHELALMGAASCKSADYLIPFGDEIFNGDSDIGEGSEDHCVELFHETEAWWRTWRSIMVDTVDSIERVCCIMIPFVPNLF